MKIIGKVPIFAGEHAIFDSNVAAKPIGQKTKDGSLVVGAEQVSSNEIWLTVEMDVRDDIFHGKEFLTFGHSQEKQGL